MHEQSETVGLTASSRALAKVERAVSYVAAASVGAIMLVVVADVAARYLFNAPLSWSYNFIGLYLMVVVFFLAIPDALTNHVHIAVDIFQHRIPFRLRHLSLGIGYGLSTVVMALVGWGGWLRFTSAWIHDDRIAAVVPWPTWIAYLLVVVGSGLMTLRCVHRSVMHVASAATGRELAEMPPAPVTDTAAAETE